MNVLAGADLLAVSARRDMDGDGLAAAGLINSVLDGPEWRAGTAIVGVIAGGRNVDFIARS